MSTKPLPFAPPKPAAPAVAVASVAPADEPLHVRKLRAPELRVQWVASTAAGLPVVLRNPGPPRW